MRRIFITIGILTAFSVANARENNLKFHFEQSINSPDIQAKLGTDIRYSFGESSDISKDFGEMVAAKQTNAFNKSDERACENAFLSALLALRDQARKKGANAVIEIRSYYKNKVLPAANQYECRAGAFIATVTLKGRIVSLAAQAAK